ncbi:hypothetical protein EAF04_005160 [Stromatinia cepivora]|nr:hypothetical protein EAF04_005160 [Stromatinia cepivora]
MPAGQSTKWHDRVMPSIKLFVWLNLLEGLSNMIEAGFAMARAEVKLEFRYCRLPRMIELSFADAQDSPGRNGPTPQTGMLIRIAMYLRNERSGSSRVLKIIPNQPSITGSHDCVSTGLGDPPPHLLPLSAGDSIAFRLKSPGAIAISTASPSIILLFLLYPNLTLSPSKSVTP